jgi:lipid-A-disaccharide synthase
MPGRFMIITGEVSGDLYGSLLAAEIMRLEPGIEISGIGGDRMRAVGVKTFLDSDDLSVVGFWEAITKLGRLRRALRYAKNQIDSVRPDLLILIDYPGMNLRLADFAKTLGIKVLYYVSPQIWAWGRNRVKLIRRSVDKMAVILPFEVDIYAREGIDVAYVGHPLMDIVKTELDRGRFFEAIGIPQDRRLVTLLPGSRLQEIKQHLGPLISTAGLLGKELPDLEFAVVTLPAFEGLVKTEIQQAGGGIAVTTDHRYEALRFSELAIACSGTTTLEAAILRTPMIVIYRLAFFSWAVGRMIVKVPYISLANLVAGERVVPEFIQSQVNPGILADEALSLLTDETRKTRMIEQLDSVKQKLGTGGATVRTAELALELADRKSARSEIQ